MLEIPYAGCFNLSQTILALEMCVAAQKREKSLKIPILRGVQRRSRSLILMSIESTYGTSY